jgi:uncharacterized membrane protein
LHIAAYITVVFSCCWACFGLGMILSGTNFTGYEPESYLWVLMLAIVCQIGAHGLFNWSLRYISQLYVSTSETTEVIYSTIIAYLLFDEVPVLMQYIGSSMIIAGILIYNYFEAASSKKVVDKTESRCYYLTQTDEGEVKLRNDLQRTGDGASPADADSDKWSPEGGAKRQPCLSSSRRKAGVIWPRV